jgi:hypothetical protein
MSNGNMMTRRPTTGRRWVEMVWNFETIIDGSSTSDYGDTGSLVLTPRTPFIR